MTCSTALSLVMFVALTELTHGIAADRAAVLIEAVDREARGTTMWEAEGRLITENSGSAAQSRTDLPFRVSLEYPPDGSTPARARLEIMGDESPLVRVCDGHVQWTYLPATGQYWKVPKPEIDACAYPFTEWRNLAAGLRLPVIVGNESLNVARGTMKCTVVREDVTAQEPAPSISRTLWIADFTKMVWQYRVERTGVSDERSVQTYTFSWQTRDGVRRSADLFQFEPTGGAELPGPPTASERTNDPSAKAPIELPKHLYRIGGFVTRPVLVHEVKPKYTKVAQRGKIQGTVIIHAVIEPNGTARDFQVVRSLDPGLDRKAIEAVSKWRFQPSVRDGNPVAVVATFEVNFKLR